LYFSQFNTSDLYTVERRVKFREQESYKKMDEKVKRKEELRQAEVEKERILEAIREQVLVVSLTYLLDVVAAADYCDNCTANYFLLLSFLPQ